MLPNLSNGVKRNTKYQQYQVLVSHIKIKQRIFYV